MSRVAWVFNGYDWPVNPETDTDWVKQHVENELVAINASKSRQQYTGTKSSRRRITGWLFGSSASAQKTQMQNWHSNRTVANLTDHNGQTVRCRLSAFDTEIVPDRIGWQNGRTTWRYTAEFVEE